MRPEDNLDHLRYLLTAHERDEAKRLIHPHPSIRSSPSTVTITLNFDLSEVQQAIADFEVAAQNGLRQAGDAMKQLRQAMEQFRYEPTAKRVRSCETCGYFVPPQNSGRKGVCNAFHDPNAMSELECHDWAEPLQSKLEVTRDPGHRTITVSMDEAEDWVTRDREPHSSPTPSIIGHFVMLTNGDLLRRNEDGGWVSRD